MHMINLIEKLACLGFVIDHELSIDLVLQSLPHSYSQFMLNFNMNKLETTVPELANMLTSAEPNLKKDKGHVMVISKSRTHKKGQKKKAQQAKETKPQKSIKKDKKPKGTYHYCNKEEHWKYNCRTYLSRLKENKHTNASTSGTYMIENYFSITSYSTQILDIGYGSHICINMQAIRNHRRLGQEEVILQMENGAKVAALAIGSCSLSLPIGLVIELSNCYYVPSIRKNIISISCLVMD